MLGHDDRGTVLCRRRRAAEVAVIDTDSGFLQVLGKRLDRLGWEHRVLAGPVPVEESSRCASARSSSTSRSSARRRWEYLERLCAALPGLGIVVCTGRSTVAQRVRGLRIGADDWLTKPCHPEELIARVEAVVRRRRRAEARRERARAAGELEIRSDRFQAFVAGRSIDLTRREFELIELLADAEGRVLEREEIYQRVWGYAMARGDRSVDVFVRKLRQKLEKASPDWRYIHTHFGVGYRFAAEPGRRGHRAEPVAATPRPPTCSPPPRRPRRAGGAYASCVTTARNVAIVPALARGDRLPARRRRRRADLRRSSRRSSSPRSSSSPGASTASTASTSTRSATPWRGLLYGAIASLVLALAAPPRLQNDRGRHARRHRAARRGRLRVLRRLAPLPRVRLTLRRAVGRPRAKMSPASHGAPHSGRPVVGEVV